MNPDNHVARTAKVGTNVYARIRHLDHLPVRADAPPLVIGRA